MSAALEHPARSAATTRREVVLGRVITTYSSSSKRDAERDREPGTGGVEPRSCLLKPGPAYWVPPTTFIISSSTHPRRNETEKGGMEETKSRGRIDGRIPAVRLEPSMIPLVERVDPARGA